MRRLRRQALGSLVGEANGDGRVNALDVAAVKRLLNTASTLAGRVDFNRDGRVNVLDVAVVKQNLGRSLAVPVVADPAFGVATARRTATGWLAG